MKIGLALTIPHPLAEQVESKRFANFKPSIELEAQMADGEDINAAIIAVKSEVKKQISILRDEINKAAVAGLI